MTLLEGLTLRREDRVRTIFGIGGEVVAIKKSYAEIRWDDSGLVSAETFDVLEREPAKAVEA
jgi:preprotein translocase subunit YajC